MISDSYHSVLDRISEAAKRSGRNAKEITLIAVTKNRPIEDIKTLYDLGIRDFGENRVQEALDKKNLTPKDIRWHLIGTLQRKKVPKVIGEFSLIHSGDRLDLLHKIDEGSQIQNLKTPILLQVNLSQELTKQGLSQKEWRTLLPQLKKFSHLEIKGLMTMAPFESTESLLRKIFSDLRHFQEELKTYFPDCSYLSMGMSRDFEIAIEEGATHVRIGSALFER